MIEFKKVGKIYPNGTKGLIDVDLKDFRDQVNLH